MTERMCACAVVFIGQKRDFSMRVSLRSDRVVCRIEGLVTNKVEHTPTS